MISRMFALVFFAGKTDEKGNVTKEEIGSINVTVDISGEGITDSIVDEIINSAKEYVLGANNSVSSKDVGSAALDPSTQNDKDVQIGLFPQPNESADTRVSRIENEFTRQEGYNDSVRGKEIAKPGDAYYMRGYTRGESDRHAWMAGHTTATAGLPVPPERVADTAFAAGWEAGRLALTT